VIRFWFSRPSYVTQTEAMQRLKVLMTDSAPPKRRDGMEWAERDEQHPACVHIYTDADDLALELKQAEEAARHVNVFPIQRVRAR
jgi:hypothetical protein